MTKALQNRFVAGEEAAAGGYPGPADVVTLFPGPVHTGFHPFSEYSSFQLGVSDGDVIEGFPEGRGRVQPGLGVGPEANTPRPQSLQSCGSIQD